MRIGLKKALFIIFIIVSMNISSVVWAKEVKRNILTTDNLDVNSINKEIEEDGKTYIYSGFDKEVIDPDVKFQSYVSEEKVLDFIDDNYLKSQFDNTYIYEDEEYSGELFIKNFDITEIDNGYQEKIDSKLIYYNNLATNDLEQIAKNRSIDGKEYVLINVEWSANSVTEIDETKVPQSYNGKALYQCIVTEKNANTYKVQATYEGTVKSKINKFNYNIKYTEKEENKIEEEKKDYVIPILIVGCLLALVFVGILCNKNATVYNIQDGKMVKIKSQKIKNGSIIDITNSEKINGNNFVLKIKESSYSKLKGKRAYIQLNKQRKSIFIIAKNNSFKF